MASTDVLPTHVYHPYPCLRQLSRPSTRASSSLQLRPSQIGRLFLGESRVRPRLLEGCCKRDVVELPSGLARDAQRVADRRPGLPLGAGESHGLLEPVLNLTLCGLQRAQAFQGIIGLHGYPNRGSVIGRLEIDRYAPIVDSLGASRQLQLTRYKPLQRFREVKMAVSFGSCARRLLLPNADITHGSRPVTCGVRGGRPVRFDPIDTSLYDEVGPKPFDAFEGRTVTIAYWQGETSAPMSFEGMVQAVGQQDGDAEAWSRAAADPAWARDNAEILDLAAPVDREMMLGQDAE